ncbi:MAG: hypothetical protein CMJ70_23720 [Planctomycetaceae bacterium]|nr:hypothetical protein [Planctomycetaceae bacterium]
MACRSRGPSQVSEIWLALDVATGSGILSDQGNVYRLVRSGLSDSVWFYRAAAQTTDEFPGHEPKKSNFSRAQTTMDQDTC